MGSALGHPSPAGGRLKDWLRREITPVRINKDMVDFIKSNLIKCYHLKNEHCFGDPSSDSSLIQQSSLQVLCTNEMKVNVIM
jgi:hypothetical protein